MLGHGRAALQVDETAVLLPQALGTLNIAAAGIGAGQGAVVGEDNGFTIGALDQGGDHVALVEVGPGKRRIRTVLLHPLMLPQGLGGHGHQGQHSIATVQVQVLGDGAQFMSWIEFPVAAAEVVLAVMAVDVPVADLLPKVMLIAAPAVDHLAEHALTDHVQQGHFLPVVAAVLKEHHGDAGVLTDAHQLPALVQ